MKTILDITIEHVNFDTNYTIIYISYSKELQYLPQGICFLVRILMSMLSEKTGHCIDQFTTNI